MDRIDQTIIEALAQDSRLSLKSLARLVSMSSPSTSERVRRLEERGVIRAFTIEIDPEAVGYAVQAIVRIKPLPGKLQRVLRLIEETPEFAECDKVTGDDCFVARLYLRSMSHLDPLLQPISEMAETNTAIVKSTPVRRRNPPLFAKR